MTLPVLPVLRTTISTNLRELPSACILGYLHLPLAIRRLLPMSLARICTFHDLSLCRHDVYAIAHHGFEPLLRPILPFLASTYSATVTIAHRIIFTYQKEVECRCACGRYLIILIYHVFRPRKFENRLNIKASIQFFKEFVS